jgi:FkbM family methyltransferase
VSIVRRVRRALARREFPVVPAHIGRIDYDGAEIRIGITSRAEFMSRLRPVTKEPWTVRWIEHNLRAGDVLYDVGANVGSYSLIAGSQGIDGLRVVAFEPGYANFAALCDNVVLNRLESVVTPLPVVLGEETGLAKLAYRDVVAGAAEHSLDPRSPAAYRQTVLAYRLDDLIEQFDLPRPTLLKLDVDGGEAAVLAGAQRTLALAGLRSALVEIDRERSDQVTPLLEQAGLALSSRVDERNGETLPNVWYGIFERS